MGFALDLQKALLKVQWPAEILGSSHASFVPAASGKALFNGLRVRLAIHTGIPASIQARHSMPSCGMGCSLDQNARSTDIFDCIQVHATICNFVNHVWDCKQDDHV